MSSINFIATFEAETYNNSGRKYYPANEPFVITENFPHSSPSRYGITKRYDGTADDVITILPGSIVDGVGSLIGLFAAYNSGSTLQKTFNIRGFENLEFDPNLEYNLSGTFSKHIADDQTWNDLKHLNHIKISELDSTFKSSNIGNTSGLSGWDTSKVDTAIQTFEFSNFNGDISGWDVSNVQYMDSMFYNAALFNIDISGWNVSNVANMNNMFGFIADYSNYDETAFNQDLTGWNVC